MRKGERAASKARRAWAGQVREGKNLLQNVVRHRLDNGLTVLLCPDQSAPVVTVMMWYRVGSRYERPGRTGISHFLEHMMFKGSSRYPKGEIDRITARLGGQNNAFTAGDYTAYFFSFASDRWWSALEIEADRMVHCLFEPDECELERQVILEELRTELDHPWGRLRKEVEENFFREHPYRHPVIGRAEDVARITRGELIEHYKSFYVPNNATLVIVGDFESGRALERVGELFGELPSQPVPQVRTREERGPGRLQLIRLTGETQVPRMLMAFPAPAVQDPAHRCLQVADKILAEGKLSRLHRSLVEEEGLISWVSSEYGETKDPYVFLLRLELEEGVSPELVQERVFGEIRKILREGITEAELQRAKRQVLTDFWADFETSLDGAVQLGLMETLDRFEYWHEYPERIARLGVEELLQSIQTFLSPEVATVGIFLRDEDEGSGLQP